MAYEEFQGTKPVAPQHAFDEASLLRKNDGYIYKCDAGCDGGCSSLARF